LFPLAARSLGSPNGGPLAGEVIFSEVHYHPAPPPAGSPLIEDQLEFVELYNRSGIPLDLSGWQISGGVDFVLPAGSTLAAGATRVLVSFDPADAAVASAFRTAYGIGPGVALVGPYVGRLDNGGEAIRLSAPTDPPAGEVDPVFYLVDRVTYGDDAPWPEAADGDGPALARRADDHFGDAAASWLAASPSPGTAIFEDAGLAGDYNGNGRVEQADLDLVLLNWGTALAQPWVDGTVDQAELDAVLLNWGAEGAVARVAAADPAPLEFSVKSEPQRAERTPVNLPAQWKHRAPADGEPADNLRIRRLAKDLVFATTAL
jgi:hypothetical protein